MILLMAALRKTFSFFWITDFLTANGFFDFSTV